MGRVTSDHVETTKRAVITVERSTNRGITDTLSCLLAMQGERTDARVFIDRDTIGAMKLMTESLDLQISSQARIAEAHEMLTGMITRFDVIGYGPGSCVPNEPGNRRATGDLAAVAAAIEHAD